MGKGGVISSGGTAWRSKSRCTGLGKARKLLVTKIGGGSLLTAGVFRSKGNETSPARELAMPAASLPTAPLGRSKGGGFSFRGASGEGIDKFAMLFGVWNCAYWRRLGNTSNLQKVSKRLLIGLDKLTPLPFKQRTANPFKAVTVGGKAFKLEQSVKFNTSSLMKL